MTIDFAFTNILVYLLVWVRLAGMILFNPLLARNGVPAMVRTGLALLMTLLLAPLQPAAVYATVYGLDGFTLMFAIVFELAIGFVYGYIFQIFYYLLFFIGDVIDTDIGLSMAKTFDPATSIQSGFSSTLITSLFCLYVFATGSHLAMFKIFADSFAAIPVGTFTLNIGILTFLLQLFTQIFAIALRLAAPFMVAEFVLQFGMGVLMKFIPQITVFVINFQLRIILGMLMLFVFAPYVGNFIGNYIEILFDSLVKATSVMATGG